MGKLSIKFILTVFCFIFNMAMVMAQTSVKGTVTDNNGEPMIGVSVLEKGTANGVITDLDGNFALRVNRGSILVFSYVGYVTQELKASANMKVTLKEDSKSLEELVVIGYGVQKKSDLTGAISQVKSEDINNRTITDATQALQGKTAGVVVSNTSAKPGATGTIRIRGISSNYDSGPLYVVDGSIMEDISGIDPNNIESMEVLKDGASAAIYGARAGNGVVLITTKKGKGDGKVSYDFQFSSQHIGHRPRLMNAKEYMQYYLEDGRFTQEKYDKDYDGFSNTDWFDVTFENSVMTHHNVSFQSGSDKGTTFVSLSYQSNDGTLKGDMDKFSRLSGMVNITRKFKPWLEITSNNQITKTNMVTFSDNYEYGNNPILSCMQLDPLTAATYPASNLPANMRAILEDPSKGELLSDGNGNYYGVSSFMLNSTINPLITSHIGREAIRSFSVVGSTAINLTPFKGFVFTSRLGYQLRNTETYGYTNDYYVNSNAYSNWLEATASESSPKFWQWENFANYATAIGDHSISGTIGTSYNESRTFSMSGAYSGNETTIGFKYDNPDFYYWAYATGGADKTLSGGEPIYTRTLSYFGRLNWSYANRYLLQVTLRADAADTSVLPANKRWGYFPAVSVGWTLSNEPFFKRLNWSNVNQIKVRASWGQNGSTASLMGRRYQYASVMSSNGSYPISTSTVAYGTSYVPTSTGNNNLKWETSEQFNVGLDFRFFDSRLSATFDYFDKKTKDLIVTGVTPSNTIGVTVSPMNAGDVDNKGFEFELGWQDNIGDFHYSVNANIATLKNKVTYVEESLGKIDGATYHQLGTITRFEKDHPAWYFYGYKFKGVDPNTGNAVFEDTNGDGAVTNDDKTEIGSGIPTYTYGITVEADYKGFDLRVFGSGQGGNQIWCLLDRSDYAVNKMADFVENRWSSSNTGGTSPRAGASNYAEYMLSSDRVYSGAFFKIKQIQLGYTLPSSLTRRIKIDRLRIYGSLDDFFTFTNYIGFDPEISGTGTSMGVDRGSYPNTKKVVLGLNVTF